MFEHPPEIRTETAERPAEKLNRLLSEIAAKENAEFAASFGADALLDDSCALRMECFAKGTGCIYERGSVAEDRGYVETKEREWAGWWNEEIRREVYEKKGIATEEDAVKDWRSRKEQQASTQFEKAVTVILHKMLGDDFLVVRASKYDDYRNGIDNLIVNKATGDVVCAFDELNYSARDAERHAKKISRVKERAMHGGSQAKYGVSVRGGKIAMEHIRNVPLFFLSLSESSLSDLMREMKGDLSAVSEKEADAFSELVGCLESQIEMLSRERVHPEVGKKIESFKDSLCLMKEKRRSARHR